MASIPLPALDIRPQPDATESIGRLMAIKSMMGQQQLQQQQVQGAQLENQQRQISLSDQQATTSAMKAWDGKDINELPSLILKNGGSSTAVFGAKNQITTLTKNAAEADGAVLKNQADRNDMIAGHLENVKGAPAEGKQDAYSAAVNDLIQKGYAKPGQLPDLYPGDDKIATIEKTFMGQKQIIQQELDTRAKNSEAQKNTAQAGEADAATSAKNAEATWYQQHPTAGAPGVPAEQVSAADWLAKNPGKTFSDYTVAMKKIVPAYNFSLQNSGAAADQNGNPSEIAKAIAGGGMGWKDAVSMRTPMATKNAILQQVYKLNPNFDTAEFGLEQDAAKKARSGAWADTRLAYNTALDHSDLLLKASDALKNNDFRALNSLSNRFKTEFGWSGQINYDAIANAYNHEVGSVVSKGHITDKEVETGNATLPDNANSQTIHDVVNSYKSLMTSKRDELDKIIKAGAGTKANATMATGSSSQDSAAAFISVTDPRGKVHKFPDQKSADAFKQEAGIK